MGILLCREYNKAHSSPRMKCENQKIPGAINGSPKPQSFQPEPPDFLSSCFFLDDHAFFSHGCKSIHTEKAEAQNRP